MIVEKLHKKRMHLIFKELGDTADLDIGSGKTPKGKVTLDRNPDFKPDIVADIQFLPIKNEAVNSLVCSHVIEHVDNLDRTINELKRVLKKGGHSFFFMPNYGSGLWRLIEPVWAMYYSKAVSKADSPKSHKHFFDSPALNLCLVKFFSSVRIGKINLGTELFAVCKS
ncbi:MAG: methyltransferase domain-containing protein [Candidatus Bathyarchaeota archaeon]